MDVLNRARVFVSIECAACKKRGAPSSLFICAGQNPWFCVNHY